jgi:hypothetical protein
MFKDCATVRWASGKGAVAGAYGWTLVIPDLAMRIQSSGSAKVNRPFARVAIIIVGTQAAGTKVPESGHKGILDLLLIQDQIFPESETPRKAIVILRFVSVEMKCISPFS